MGTGIGWGEDNSGGGVYIMAIVNSVLIVTSDK